jgi:hypothetical protein
MKKTSAVIAAITILASATTALWAMSDEYQGTIKVAEFDADGYLKRPTDIEKWVFLGASLGMGYNEQVSFDPDTPGNFQTVLMEPSAFEVFEKTGKFPDGSMFALIFNGTETNVSINQSGFVMGDELALEIHLKDKARFPETGFNFYFFGKGAETAPTRPAPNACTNCHMEHAEYDGVFTQFYPTIRDRIAKSD